MRFSNPTDTSTFRLAQMAGRGEYSFADNYTSSRRMFNALNTSDGPGSVISEILEPIVGRVNEVAKENGLEIPDDPHISSASSFFSDVDWGRSFTEPGIKYDKQIVNPGNQLTGYSSIDLLNNVKDEEKYNTSLNILLGFIQENKELFPDLQDLSAEKILEDAKKLTLEIQQAALEIEELSPGFNAAFARFAGTAEAAVTDPKVVASLVPSVAAAFIPGVNIYGVMIAEGLIGAGTEWFIQEDVQEWYQELGLDYTPEQFRNAVLTAGIASAGSAGVLYIAGKAVQLTFGQLKKGYEAFKKAGLLRNSAVTEQQELLAERIANNAEDASVYSGVKNNDATSASAQTEFNTKLSAVAHGETIPVSSKNEIAPEAYDNFEIDVKTKAESVVAASNKVDVNVDLDLDIIKKTNALRKQTVTTSETVTKTVKRKKVVSKETDVTQGHVIFGTDDGLTPFGGTGVFKGFYGKNQFGKYSSGQNKTAQEVYYLTEARGTAGRGQEPTTVIDFKNKKIIRAARNARDRSNRSGMVGALVAVPKNATKEQIEYAKRRAESLADSIASKGVAKGQVTKAAEATLKNPPPKEVSKKFDAEEEFAETIEETVKKKVPKKIDLEEFRAEARKDVKSVYTHAHDAKEAAIRKNIGDDAADAYNEAGMNQARKNLEKKAGKNKEPGNPRGRLDDATVTVRQVELKDVNLDKFDDPIEGMDSNLEALKAEALENVGGDITKEVDIPLETVGDEVTVEVTSLGKLQKSFEEEDALEKAVSGCA